VLDAEVFNAAIAKRFDAKDYFSSAPKGFVLKAIAEAINQDEARKIAGKTKPEIWKVRARQCQQDRLAAEGAAHGALQGAGQRGLQAAKKKETLDA
jgi:hypothetical protein